MCRDDLAKKIMLQTDCLSMMRLGNLAKPKRESGWFQKREEVMKSALLAKFSQNVTLQQKLEATANLTLVETTRDHFWGAGVTMNASALMNGTWSGQNTLGKLLAEVRSYFKNK